MHPGMHLKALSYCVAIAAVAAACVPPVPGPAVGVPDSKAAVPAAAKAVSASSRAVDAVALASSLASYGYRTNSPLSLLTAAELLLDASPSPLTGKQGQPSTMAPKPGPTFSVDPEALISSALSMGGNDTTVSVLASKLQNRVRRPTAVAAVRGFKGVVGGARSTTSRVAAYSTDWWDITFRGSELASIRVRGDGDTDLDCYVYNSAGTLLDHDNDYTDYCILDWYQSYTGAVRLEIRNLGAVYNEYVLTTN